MSFLSIYLILPLYQANSLAATNQLYCTANVDQKTKRKIPQMEYAVTAWERGRNLQVSTQSGGDCEKILVTFCSRPAKAMDIRR